MTKPDYDVDEVIPQLLLVLLMGVGEWREGEREVKTFICNGMLGGSLLIVLKEEFSSCSMTRL